MATEGRSTKAGVVLYRLTVRQYLKMIDAGVFPEGHRVELLGGVIVDKRGRGPAAVAAQATGSGVVPYRLTVRQFLKAIDAGVFPEGARVELLGGLLVDKMTKNDPHDFAISELGDALRGLLPPGFFVREEKSVVLGRNWRPEPDIAVVRTPRPRFRSGAPRAADLAFLVEVADASYATDRGPKWRRYAGCGVAVYWIVNIPQARIEVYGAPAGRGRSATYRDCTTYGPDEQVPVVLDGREVGRVAPRDFLL
jgi:Uma2 family endonuclease